MEKFDAMIIDRKMNQNPQIDYKLRLKVAHFRTELGLHEGRSVKSQKRRSFRDDYQQLNESADRNKSTGPKLVGTLEALGSIVASETRPSQAVAEKLKDLDSDLHIFCIGRRD